MPRRRLVPAVVLALLLAAGPARADTTPPAPPTIIVDTPLFGFTGEPLGSFECRVDGGLWTACVAPWDSGVATVGDHTVEIRQIDDSGNVGAPASFSWTNAPAEEDPAAETATPLDGALPLDGVQPVGIAAPAASDPGAPTGQPLEAENAIPVTARPRLQVRIGRVRGGFVPVRCALRGATVGRCDVALGPAPGAGVTVLTGRSSFGHGATLSSAGRRTAVVYVELTPLAASLLRSRRALPVLVQVHVRPDRGRRRLATEQRAVLRY